MEPGDCQEGRELVGGIYFGEKIEGTSTNMEYSSDECKYTRKED